MTTKTTVITLEKASKVNFAGTQYNEANPEISKITFAVQRILNQTNKTKPFEDYTDALEEHKAKLDAIDMKYASTEADSPKLLLDEKGGKIYTGPSDEKRKTEILTENKRWRAQSAELLSATIEVKQHIVEDQHLISAGLTMDFIDTFDELILHAEDLYGKILQDKPDKPQKPG